MQNNYFILSREKLSAYAYGKSWWIFNPSWTKSPDYTYQDIIFLRGQIFTWPNQEYEFYIMSLIQRRIKKREIEIIIQKTNQTFLLFKDQGQANPGANIFLPPPPGEKIWWFVKKKREYKREEVEKRGKKWNFHCTFNMIMRIWFINKILIYLQYKVLEMKIW